MHFPDANCLPNFQNVWDIPKYLPCKDFNVAESMTVTTSIFVSSLADIIHSTDGDTDQILKCELTSRQREEIVEETTGQSSSARWYFHRQGPITGSIAHRCLHLREKTDPEDTVDVIIEGNTYFDSSNPPYGKVHEDDAIKKHILSEKAHHSNLKALQTGLHVIQDLVFLGAGPDGLLNCDCCQIPRPHEVKCLYSGQYLDPKEAAMESGKFLEVD